MKPKINFIFVLLCFTISSWSQTLKVKGHITDIDTLMILFRNIDRCDTAYTNNGKFTFTRTLSFPDFFTISIIKNKQSIEAIKGGNERKIRSKSDGIYREIFLEPGEVFIQTKFSDFKKTSFRGLKFIAQKKYDEFNNRFRPLIKLARIVVDSSFVPNKTEIEKATYRILYQNIINVENEVAEKFILENTNNMVGAYLLYQYYRSENRHKLDSIYTLFNKNLYSTVYLKNVKAKIAALSGLKEGQLVPPISILTKEGNKVSLSDFSGKYIVLDFWGSWCPPCIAGLPKMRAYHNKYSAKIVFIGIACNDQKSEWESTIEKYQMNWIQTLNDEKKNNLATLYNIETYPTKILIDPKGVLIKIFTGETQEFYQTINSLFL